MNSIMKGFFLVCLLPLTSALIQEGIIRCGNDHHWRLTGYDPTIRLNERESVNNIKFPIPYTSTPAVTVSVHQLDTDRFQNLRYELRLTSVTTTGFKLSCVTWHHTGIYSLNVRWVSLSDSAQQIDSDGGIVVAK
uniref:H-type lectin domain-containing protein n=1 Tax=Arion vulgaris TaxID=1028688 RepID=A0A0B7AZ29_9EUPU